MGPNPVTDVHIKIWTQRQTCIEGRWCEETQWEDGHLEAKGRPGIDPSLMAVKRNQPYQQLAFGLLVSRTGGQCNFLVQATRFVILCYAAFANWYTDITKSRWGHTGLRWALIHDWCIYKKRKLERHRETPHTHREEHLVTRDGEITVMHLQTKECQWSLATTESRRQAQNQLSFRAL